MQEGSISNLEVQQIKLLLAYSVHEKRRKRIQNDMNTVRQRDIAILALEIVKQMPCEIKRSKGRSRNIRIRNYVVRSLDARCDCEGDRHDCPILRDYENQLVTSVHIFLKEERKGYSRTLELIEDLIKNPLHIDIPDSKDLKEIDKKTIQTTVDLIETVLPTAMWRYSLSQPLLPVETLMIQRWIPYLVTHPTAKRIFSEIKRAIPALMDITLCRNCLKKRGQNYCICTTCKVPSFCSQSCYEESMKNQLHGHIVECPILLNVTK